MTVMVSSDRPDAYSKIKQSSSFINPTSSFSLDNQTPFSFSDGLPLSIKESQPFSKNLSAYLSSLSFNEKKLEKEVFNIDTTATSTGFLDIYYHDSKGQLIGELSARGELSTYDYNDEGKRVTTHRYAHLFAPIKMTESLPELNQLSTNSSSADRISHIIYNAFGQMAYTLSETGAVVGYSYNGEGNLSTKTAYATSLPLDKPYATDRDIFMSLEAHQLDRTTFYYYTEKGYLLAEVEPNGHAYAYTYDAQGHCTESRSFATQSVKKKTGDWEIDKPGYSGDDLVSYYLYDKTGLLIGEIDPESYLTEYRYNEKNLVSTKIAYATPLQNLPVLSSLTDIALIRPSADKNNRATDYIYNSLNQCIREEQSNHLQINRTFDAKGHVLFEEKIDTKSNEARHTMQQYDDMGRLISSINNPGVTEQQYIYNAQGLIAAAINIKGEKTQYFYSDTGLLIYVVLADGSVTEWRYGDFYNVSAKVSYSHQILLNVEQNYSTDDIRQLTNTIADSLHDRVVIYTYDRQGQLIKTNENGQEVTLTYNTFGEKTTRAMTVNQQAILDQFDYDQSGALIKETHDAHHLSQIIQWEYDVFGRKIKEERLGLEPIYYQYDKLGREILMTDSAHKTHSTRYDAFSRIIYRSDSLESFCYDDAVNTLTIKRANEDVFIRIQFNAFGDQLELKDKNGQLTRYLYDVNGELISVFKNGIQTEEYAYNQLGEVILKRDSTGVTYQYEYDAQGRVLKAIADPLGSAVATKYTYDALGHTLSIETAGLTESFVYNSAGYLVRKISDPAHLAITTDFLYDEKGHLLEEILYNGEKKDRTAYRFDTLGRCIEKVKDPDGLAIRTLYDYDLNDHLIKVTDARGYSEHYLYDKAGNLSYEINPKGIVTHHLYDDRGNEIETTVYSNALSLNDIAKLSTSNIHQFIRPTTQDEQTSAVFDALNRKITSFDAMGYVTHYDYDKTDHLVAVKREGQSSYDTEVRITRYLYNNNQQIRAKFENQHVTTYVYDGAGHIIQERELAILFPDNIACDSVFMKRCLAIDDKSLQTSEDKVTYYAYDSFSRLSLTINPMGQVNQYIYDASGHVIETIAYANGFIPSTDNHLNGFLTAIQKSPKDRHTYYIYDACQRERFSISPMGAVKEKRYDDCGNVLMERTYQSFVPIKAYTEASIEKELRDLSIKSIDLISQYDTAGRKVLDQIGDKKTNYAYDAQAHLISKVDGDYAVIQYVYDELQQLIEIHSPCDKNATTVTLLRYDSFGNLIETIDDAYGIGATTQYEYDKNNRKVKANYQDCIVDRHSKPVTLSESFEYNAFDEVISQIDKKGNRSYATYNIDGQLAYVQDGCHYLTEYTYDTLGRMIGICYYATPFEYENVSCNDIKRFKKSSDSDRHTYFSYNKNDDVIEMRKDAVPVYDAYSRNYIKASPTTQYIYNVFNELTIISENALSQAPLETYSYYNDDGIVIASIDKGGYLTQKQVNAQGLLMEEIQYAKPVPWHGKESYTTPLTSLEDRRKRFTYNTSGQLIAETYVNVTYDRLIPETNRTASITEDITFDYVYDALGRLIQTIDALGYSTQSYYDNQGHLIASVGKAEAKGRSLSTYTYDGLGRLVSIKQWVQGVHNTSLQAMSEPISDADDINCQNHYDQWGHLVEAIDGMGHSIFYGYDENGNKVHEWQWVTSSDGQSTKREKCYSYDAKNQCIQEGNEQYIYNAFSEVIEKKLNGSSLTSTTYDLIGRASRQTIQDTTTFYAYDLQGHVTRIVSPLLESSASLKQKDLLGIDIKTDAATLFIQTNQYDRLGHCIAQFNNRNNSGIQEESLLSSQQFDRFGNILSTTDALGYQTTYSYNALDKVTMQQLPLAEVVDEHGSLINAHPVITYAYDAAGRLIGMRDPNGHYSAAILNANGQRISEIDALLFQRETTYNLLGQVSSEKDERGILTTYAYDAANRLVTVSRGNLNEYYAYDEAGALITHTNAQALSEQYTYNNEGQLSSRNSAQSGKVVYSYDIWGHQVREQNAKGDTRVWVYDENGQVLKYQDWGGHETVYTYDNRGHVLTETSSQGKHIQYAYFNDGTLESTQDIALNEKISYIYDKRSQVIEKKSSSSRWSTENELYTYDALGRLASAVRDSADPASAYTLHYAYDASNNVRSSTLFAQKLNAATTDYYTYDANDRVVINQGELINGRIVITERQGSSYGYDGVGNITSATRIESKQYVAYTYSYNVLNDIEIIRKNNKTLVTRQYDSDHHLVEEHFYDVDGLVARTWHATYKDDKRTYEATYDRLGVLIRASGYAYDAVGNLTYLRVDDLEQGASIQQHYFTYEPWDTYQQQGEYLSFSASGYNPTSSNSLYKYDVNGHLISTTDSGGAHNTTYTVSAFEGIKKRKAEEGLYTYLSSLNTMIGEIETHHNQSKVQLYGGFVPAGEYHKRQTHFDQNVMLSPQADWYSQKNKPVIPPEMPDLGGDRYVVAQSDTLESIAAQAYGDSSLWYLIARANGIDDRQAVGSDTSETLFVGRELKLPRVSYGTHQTDQIKPLFSANRWIGDTSATLSQLVAINVPSSKHHDFWRMVTGLLITVSATVASVMTAGAVTGLLVASGRMGISLLGAATTRFAAGIAGGLVSEGMLKLTGYSSHIDITNILTAGLAAAATAGIARVMSRQGPIEQTLDNLSFSGFDMVDAAQAISQEAANQAVKMALIKDQSISWSHIAMAGAVGGSNKALSHFMQNKIEPYTGEIMPFIESELNAFLIEGGNAILLKRPLNVLNILQDNAGAGLANMFFQSPSASKETYPYCSTPEKVNGNINTRKADDLYDVMARTGYQYATKMITWGEELIDFWKENADAVSLENTKDIHKSSSNSNNATHNVKKIKVGQYDVNYDALFAKKGSPYRNIVKDSFYNQSPGSPIAGDASKELQIKSIDSIISTAMKHELTENDTAQLLAIAKHESGFNPYAAAGTTSATGLGQFIIKTGKAYNIGDHNRWDIDAQSNALVKLYIDNKKIVRRNNKSDEYIYKLHHDGSWSDLNNINSDGMRLSCKYIQPQIKDIHNAIYKVFH